MIHKKALHLLLMLPHFIPKNKSQTEPRLLQQGLPQLWGHQFSVLVFSVKSNSIARPEFWPQSDSISCHSPPISSPSSNWPTHLPITLDFSFFSKHYTPLHKPLSLIFPESPSFYFFLIHSLRLNSNIITSVKSFLCSYPHPVLFLSPAILPQHSSPLLPELEVCLLNQITEANIRTPGCGEGKYSIYCRAPSKESGQLMFKRLDGFQRRVFKSNIKGEGFRVSALFSFGLWTFFSLAGGKVTIQESQQSTFWFWLVWWSAGRHQPPEVRVLVSTEQLKDMSQSVIYIPSGGTRSSVTLLSND